MSARAHWFAADDGIAMTTEEETTDKVNEESSADVKATEQAGKAEE